MKILVTGASGFIGSAFIRRMCSEFDSNDLSIIGLIRNTAHKNMHRLDMDKCVNVHIAKGSVHLVNGDLLGDISGICEGVDWVVNFAAKTFVDHSIRDAEPFVNTNVLGTMKLLEDARRNKVKRFLQVSTDEVYGAILEGAYSENSPVNPTNPYSASKLGADALAICYAHTYGLHTIVTRTENNYGPFQHPQKVLPTFVKKALAGHALPVYGDGLHSRQWLYVDDHVDGILMLLHKDVPPGEVFHIAGSQELTNLQLANAVHSFTERETGIQFIEDHNIRPGHDRRYALKCEKMAKLGWTPKINLSIGLPKAIKWYVDNQWWLK
jgi:dTDP-glucose 4,6-dehydratase